MGKFDALLKKAEMFEKLAVYSDRKAFLQALSQEDPWAAVRQKLDEEAGQPTTIPPPPAAPQHFTMPEQVSITKAPKPAMPAVSKETQDQLNQLLLPYGKIAVPLKLNGVLGPETQKALDAFKQTYGKPGTPAAIKEVYLQVKHPELETKTPF